MKTWRSRISLIACRFVFDPPFNNKIKLSRQQAQESIELNKYALASLIFYTIRNAVTNKNRVLKSNYFISEKGIIFVLIFVILVFNVCLVMSFVNTTLVVINSVELTQLS